jgi:diguanylate cyclase (GGDEF)-like protein
MGHINPFGHGNDLALLAQAAPLAGIGAFECDLRDESLRWTDGVFTLFGIDRGDRLDRRETLTFYTPPTREALEQARASAISARSAFELEAQIVRPDGASRWLRIRAAVRSAHGRATHLYGLKEDISADRARLDELRRRFEMDPLTGLPGRAPFQRDFLDARAIRREMVLILFDVDGFKLVNDRHGHAAGDACLAAVATRLSRAFGGATLIARIGGDEFAVLMDRPVSCCRVLAQTAAALRRITRPILFGDHVLQVSASAGIAFAADIDKHCPAALFEATDAALYRAKRAGRNAYSMHPAPPSPT